MVSVDGMAGSQNSENTGIIEASSVRSIIVGLESKTERVSAQVYNAARDVVHRGTNER